jgi:transcriptional regulator of aromatic amino acid metabolism
MRKRRACLKSPITALSSSMRSLNLMSAYRQNYFVRCKREEIRRVGGTHEIATDVRVIAATNRDLRAMVSDGRFRDDLYYRINVLSIDVPPLRERREDIPVLIDYFLKKHTRNTSRLVRGLTPDTKKLMSDYSWPVMFDNSSRPSNELFCSVKEILLLWKIFPLKYDKTLGRYLKAHSNFRRKA